MSSHPAAAVAAACRSSNMDVRLLVLAERRVCGMDMVAGCRVQMLEGIGHHNKCSVLSGCGGNLKVLLCV